MNPAWQDLAGPFIQGFESCCLTAYHGAADQAGLFTIGWGATGPGIGEGLVWTQSQADADFADRLETFGAGVDALVTVAISNHEKAALVSFAYNLGLGALGSSTLLRLLNSGDHGGAGMQFPLWNHSNGVVVPGLTRRRLAEQVLFSTPDGAAA